MSSHPHAERRTEAYAFRSLRDLMSYYSDFMPMGKIEQCVRDCAMYFSVRRNATREEERLQFIKRCENAIKADLTLLQQAFSRKPAAVVASTASPGKGSKPTRAGGTAPLRPAAGHPPYYRCL